MSTTQAYHVGTPYRIAPLHFTTEESFTYSLIDAPEHFYINPRTGVVIATFTPDDVTIDRSSGGVANKESLTVTLQTIADTGDRRAVVEVYTFYIKDRETFELVRGSRVIDERFRKQYIADGNDEATIIGVDTPFRIAARRVDQNKTTLSKGGFGNIRYTFKVLDTATGDQIDAGLLSITSSGELLGVFHNETGKFAIVVTATDGGGANFQLDPITLDVRQRDVDVPSYGPNGRGCANNGAPVDSSGDLFDGKFTSCDCRGTFVGENCEEQCNEGEIKDATSGKCAIELSGVVITRATSVAGALVLLMLLMLSAVRHYRFKRRMQPLDFDELKLKMGRNGTITESQLSDCNLKPRELKRSNIVLLEQVGRGAFGTVWNAVLDESAITGRPEYQVAAKIVLDSSTVEVAAAATEDLATEAMVMAQLKEHVNLVSIIGVVTSGKPLILVLAYCDHGSMQGHLQSSVRRGKAVPAAYKIDFAAQTARGMAHLAKHQFIHRDLAARNVLLASGKSISSLVCKVADFGLARGGGRSRGISRTEDEYEDVYYRSHAGGVLPIRWTAPEAFEQLKFTYASDVWSFAMTIIEIIQNGAKPFRQITSNHDVMQCVVLGQVHPKPQECAADDSLTALYDLAVTCLASDPADRPAFLELADNLETLVQLSTCYHRGEGEDHGALELSVPGVDAAVSTLDLPTTSEAQLSELASTYEYSSNVRVSLVEQRQRSQAGMLVSHAATMPDEGQPHASATLVGCFRSQSTGRTSTFSKFTVVC
jgi:serine/threonine protein kinase